MNSTTRFHFKSALGWLNDPNGLVHLDGEYHMFFQHHPGSAVWGPMHWGHAVSKDLLEWTELPIALEPDPLGQIFSGSIVADKENRFGLSQSGETVLIAFFTHHNRAAFLNGEKDFEHQSAAISRDKGRTWEKYTNNPVLPNPGNKTDFRDPFVFWHAETQAWIMIVSAGSHAEIYRSKTLDGWSLSSRFDAGLSPEMGIWECPALCQVPLENGAGHRWMLIQSFNPGGRYGGSGTQYFVGHFDGYQFEVEAPFQALLSKQGPQWLDWGPDHYAANVWGNSPRQDGKPIVLGWMNNWAYANNTFEAPFRGRMTLPRTLSLVEECQALVLHSDPIPGAHNVEIEKSETPIPEIGDDDLIILELETYPSQNELASIALKSGARKIVTLQYCLRNDEFLIDRKNGPPANISDISDSIFRFPRLRQDPTLAVTVCLSKGGAEIYLDGGTQTATVLFDPRLSIETVAHRGWKNPRGKGALKE